MILVPAFPEPGGYYRNGSNDDQRKNNVPDVILHPGIGPEVIADAAGRPGPGNRADHIVKHELPQPDADDTGKNGRKGPDNGQKAPDDQCLAAVPVIKVPCYSNISFFEDE